MTTLMQPRVAGFELAVPLTVVAVELDAQEGLLIVTNLEPGAHEASVGDRVEIFFEQISDDLGLPQARRLPARSV
jgi:uncharacterized OB-fold protein